MTKLGTHKTRKITSWLGAICVAILLSTSLAWSYNFEPGEYEAIKEVSIQLLRRCPPQSCVLVGIGRSPTPIVAFLQAIDPEIASNLPLSGFRYSMQDENRSLDPAQQSLLYEHFTHFLPPLGERKKMILIDFSVSGQSLLSAREYIDDLMKKKGISVEIDAVPIVPTSYYSTVRTEFAEKSARFSPIVVREDGKFEALLLDQSYDGYGQYGPLRIADLGKPSQLKENPRYVDLLESMRKAVNLDSDLLQLFESGLLGHSVFSDRRLVMRACLKAASQALSAFGGR